MSTDTVDNSTTGKLGWSTPATRASAPGRYRIDGGGLAAENYAFEQASGPDASMLTLLPSTLPPQVVSTVTQFFDSVPLPDPTKKQSPGSPTNFKGLSIVGPGVNLPPTLIVSAQ